MVLTGTPNGVRYSVRLSVPRRGGWRAWGSARGDFERCLAAQESSVVVAPRVDSEIRRGRDYVRAVIVATVDAADVAEALDLAWWAYQKAAGDDLAGWDLASVTTEVRPEAPLAGPAAQGAWSMRGDLLRALGVSWSITGGA